MSIYLKIEHCDVVQHYRYTNLRRYRVNLRPTHPHSQKISVLFYDPCYPVAQWLNEHAPNWRMNRETRRMRFRDFRHAFAFQMRWDERRHH